TYNPGVDRVRGWTPDGKRVVFVSDRLSAPQNAYQRLFTVAASGGMEEPLPMPRAVSGSYSPDAKHIAYEEISTQFIPAWYEISFWRHYRGGRTHPVRIMDLSSYTVEKLPWKDSNDSYPMWVGNTIYFLSDRDYTKNLFAYDLSTKQVKEVTHHEDGDIMNASATSDAVVYEQNGLIHVYDAKSGQTRPLTVDIVGDFPWARAQFRRVGTMIRSASLSPTGVRAAFEARGDIFTVPVEKGDYRNLSQTPGAHDREPVWSPDGTELAWISDASGEDQLLVGDQSGLNKPRSIPLPVGSYFSNLAWSPNGKMLLASDNHLGLWTIDATSGQRTKIDTDTYSTPGRDFDATWSPDSRWVAYSKSLDSHLRAIFVRQIGGADAQPKRLTDALADAVSPSFDANGKYLYFLASTDFGPRTGWVEMSAVDRPVHRSIYLAVLNANDPSPLLPEVGDEPATPTIAALQAGAPAGGAPQGGRGRGAMADTTPLRIDLAGIGQRILSLEVPPGDYNSLIAGPTGTVFYLEPVGEGGRGGLRLQKYSLKDHTTAPFLDGVRSVTLSADRKKLLYSAGGGANTRWGVVGTDRPARAGEGPVNVAQLESYIDPKAEWAEVFRESWRGQRDFFYDPKMHGADWQAVLAKYSPLVASVNHRSDLGYLIAQTGGELVVGHSYLSGAGDMPPDTPQNVGLLGADYTIENGHYRFHRILTGENWNPELRAPMSAPGIKVSEGDYLLEVNGRPVAPPLNVYEPFQGTAGHQTVLRVNSTPSMEGSRLVTVVPVANEMGLRTRAWIEHNRHLVDSLSGGKLAYVWLPNTSIPGYNAFTRDFYAQQDRDGAIIDERYNEGGLVADYIVNELDRKQLGYFAMRDGKSWTSPGAGIFGAKVMLINESAGSGGDALPFYFKQRKIGLLVGTRTWGGLVGTTGVPATIDGGGITAPGLAFYDLDGKWAVENEGVTPDVDVEYSAPEVIKGRDPQIERAVQEGLRMLQQHPVAHEGRPTPIDRTKKP
ncbi:MAG TPA: PDZ domain-containing protein, partial [Gemmatimonadaceae bacterium]